MQTKLIDCMKAFGYQSDKDGVCFGVSHMAKQAILAGDLDTFKKRLELIYSKTPDELLKLVALNQQKPMEQQDELLASIHAFFNGIELYHQPENYEEWFPPQEAYMPQSDIAADIVLSSNLERDDGIQTIDTLTGVYSQSELAEHFKNLSEMIKEAKLDTPIAFTLRNCNHAIEVGYDPKKGWVLFDANHMPGINIYGHNGFEALASNISRSYDYSIASAWSLRPRNPVIITTNIHTTGLNASLLTPVIQRWKSTPSFQQTHDVSNQDKVNASEYSQGTWLYNAAAEGLGETVKQLLENQFDINKAISSGATPLYIAAQNGHKEIVKMLLEKNADLNKATSSGTTPLYIAAQIGHKEIVKMLLEKNADLNKVTSSEAAPLHIAVQIGHKEIVKMLLEKNAAINNADSSGSTPLFTAAVHGYTEVVKILLEREAEIDKGHSSGATPLIVAAQNGHKEIVKILLDRGAEINKASLPGAPLNGATPLILAAQNGHMEIVEILLERGAEIDKSSLPGAPLDGTTPLIQAALSGHKEIVKMLLDKNADINKANSSGITPLFMAAQNGHMEIVRMLLEQGAEIDKAHSSGGTPLLVAAINGHKDIVMLLLKNGAELDKASLPGGSLNGATPLFLAAQSGHMEIVDILLEKGAEIDKAHLSGATPLFVAAQNGHIGTVKILLERGADINQANLSGATPFTIAEKNRHNDIAALLLKKKISEIAPQLHEFASSLKFDEIKMLGLDQLFINKDGTFKNENDAKYKEEIQLYMRQLPFWKNNYKNFPALVGWHVNIVKNNMMDPINPRETTMPIENLLGPDETLVRFLNSILTKNEALTYKSIAALAEYYYHGDRRECMEIIDATNDGIKLSPAICERIRNNNKFPKNNPDLNRILEKIQPNFNVITSNEYEQIADISFQSLFEAQDTADAKARLTGFQDLKTGLNKGILKKDRGPNTVAMSSLLNMSADKVDQSLQAIISYSKAMTALNQLTEMRFSNSRSANEAPDKNQIAAIKQAEKACVSAWEELFKQAQSADYVIKENLQNRIIDALQQHKTLNQAGVQPHQLTSHIALAIKLLKTAANHKLFKEHKDMFAEKRNTIVTPRQKLTAVIQSLKEKEKDMKREIESRMKTNGRARSNRL